MGDDDSDREPGFEDFLRASKGTGPVPRRAGAAFTNWLIKLGFRVRPEPITGTARGSQAPQTGHATGTVKPPSAPRFELLLSFALMGLGTIPFPDPIKALLWIASWGVIVHVAVRYSRHRSWPTPIQWGIGVVVALLGVIILWSPIKGLNLIPKTQATASGVSESAGHIYGDLALHCSPRANSGSANYQYILYEPPTGPAQPHFTIFSMSPMPRVPATSVVTCILHNDGLQPVYQLALDFGYKIIQPNYHKPISDTELIDSPVIVPRVAGGAAVSLRFYDDLPGEDYLLEPRSACSMEREESPGARIPCAVHLNEYWGMF